MKSNIHDLENDRLLDEGYTDKEQEDSYSEDTGLDYSGVFDDYIKKANPLW